MAGNFEAAVSAWAAKSERRMTAVFREATQSLSNEVRKPKSEGGHMPIVTGNLRRSLLASTSEIPTLKPGAEDFSENDKQITLTIAGATLGETIYLGFQAAYARRMEYGFKGQDSLGRTYNQAGNGFVRLAVQRWQAIVDEAARTIQSRVESR
ncbi:hypothetical protein [Consotaella aegiceratis]|uniref:hypothetical protein n=1 Tax=Consotaella aegiceratis TaxID=3097961 RepID=UPI002F3E7C67